MDYNRYDDYDRGYYGSGRRYGSYYGGYGGYGDYDRYGSSYDRYGDYGYGGYSTLPGYSIRPLGDFDYRSGYNNGYGYGSYGGYARGDRYARDTLNRGSSYPAWYTSEGGYRNSYGAVMDTVNRIWETSKVSTVQGGSLLTWSFSNPQVRRLHVLMKTDGRPLDANVEVWNGPDNIPQKMKVYLEDGGRNTFSTFIDTPRAPNTVAIRNTGPLAFPLQACVGPDYEAGERALDILERSRGRVIQGGALLTYPFDPAVDSVAVMLRSDGRPLNARIELIQGPSNNKQVMEIYTDDGYDRPFYALIQTPGPGSVVRIVNTAPVEFPITASVEAFEVGLPGNYDYDGVILGRDNDRYRRSGRSSSWPYW
jgi:hypothetical protein